MNGVPDTRTSPVFPLGAIALLLLLAPARLLPAASPERPDVFAPPRHCAPPGKGHAVTNRGFTGIPSVAVAPQGRLWATWYAGVTPGEDLNNYAVLATSGDGGTTWREVLVVDPDARGPLRAFDPELYDLAMDPDESQNMGAEHRQAVEELSAAIRTRLKNHTLSRSTHPRSLP